MVRINIKFNCFCLLGCGHCKKSKPEFNKAAENYKNDPKIEFAAVDCTVHHSLCLANDIKGYPTFKYFSYFKIGRQYTGGRTAEDFITFMNDPEQPMTPKIKDEKNEFITAKSVVHLTDNSFKSEISTNAPVLVMFYAPCKYFLQFCPSN